MAQEMTAPVVAIFVWGETIEEFLDPIGMSLHAFAQDMSGGWLFGYVAALQTAGWASVIVCGSTSVTGATRLIHRGTGTPIWALPARRIAPSLARNHPSRASLQHWWHAPWRGFARVLRQERCAAILVQEYEYARLEVLRVLGRLLGLPVHASFQGGDRTASSLEASVRARSIAGCKSLIVASSAERARLVRTYGRRLPPVVAIPNPLDTQVWSPQPRAEARAALCLPADSFIAICHGRVDIHRKGLDVLLAAWQRFRASQPRQVRLVLIGSGQDHDAFAELLRVTNDPTIDWHSSYTNDRAALRQWLAAADVYVSASRTEGMPVAPLEAMALGLPVVCAAAQGIPDILGGGEASGGVVVPVEDPLALAYALARLAGDPAVRASMASAARNRVEAAFSLPVVGCALAGVLGRTPNV